MELRNVPGTRAGNRDFRVLNSRHSHTLLPNHPWDYASASPARRVVPTARADAALLSPTWQPVV